MAHRPHPPTAPRTARPLPPPWKAPWSLTAADLGLDLDHAVHHPDYTELDALCRTAGVIGDTYATGTPDGPPRAAYAVIGGTLHTAPARFDGCRCYWPAPGGNPPITRGHLELTHAENRSERYADEHGTAIGA